MNPLELKSLGTLASKDLDYQTTKDVVEACGRRVNLRLETPKAGTKTELIGVVRFKVQEEECKVDFLNMPFGLSAEEVNQLKLKFDIGSISLYVMHPLHCLESRTINVAQLPRQYANVNGFGQLKAAIVMVRAFVLKEAELDAEQAANMCTRISKFCFGDSALEVHRDHQIDVFEAIPKEVLPQKVFGRAYPTGKDSFARGERSSPRLPDVSIELRWLITPPFSTPAANPRPFSRLRSCARLSLRLE